MVSTYLIGFVLGYFFSIDSNILNVNVLPQSKPNITELYHLDSFSRFKEIALNNLTVSTKCFIFGAFSYGVYSIIIVFLNAFVLGSIVGSSTQILSFKEICGSLLPHSPEILGLIVFGYCGFSISNDFFKYHTSSSLRRYILFILIASLIILISAFLESYVSIQS